MSIPRGTQSPDLPPVHPGEVLLEEFLRPMAMTQTEAAEKMGISLNRLNVVVRGKCGVSAQSALRLAELLGTSPQFWLNLQAAVDLYYANNETDPRAGAPLKPSRRAARFNKIAH